MPSRVHEATVFALAYQAELRDRETGNHLERTARYVESLATQLRRTPELQQYLTKSYIRDISLASYLHDVGKWGSPTPFSSSRGSSRKRALRAQPE